MRLPKNISDHYFEINVFFMAFVLPCSIDVATRYIYIFIFLNLVYFLQAKQPPSKVFVRSPGFYLPVFYFLICFLSILPGLPQSARVLEKFVILMAFPIMIFLNGQKYQQPHIRSILFSGFIVGNAAVGVVNIFNAFANSLSIDNGQLKFDSSVYGNTPFWWSLDHVGNYFFSIHFTDFIHPTYWSLYLTICIALLMASDPFRYISLSNNKKALKLILICFFLLMLALAASRAGMIGLLITVIVLGGAHIKKTKFSTKLVFITAVFLVAVFSLISANPRMNALIREIESGNYVHSPRLASWIASISVIRESGFIGVGLHNAEHVLMEKYDAFNFVENYENQYNAHQQFLETFMSVGLVGLVVLVLVFVTGIIKAVREGDLIFALFLMNLLTHFMFESMLDRFHGIAIFALFYPLLWHTAASVGRSESFPKNVLAA